MPDLLPAASGILDPSNPLLYALGGGNTAGLSYPELQRRRAIAQALASQKRGFPKNIGEGLTSLGEAVGDRMTDARLAAAERGYVGDRATNPLLQPPPPAAPAAPAGPAPAPAVGPRTDATDPILQRSNIAALMVQGGPGVPQPNPTLAATEGSPTMTATAAPSTPAAGGPASDDDGMWGARSAAIGGIETGGTKDPYSTIGKAQTKYGNALGKYGVMTANVPKWTQEALGQALTPEQFLANPQAQDVVFKHRFGQYVARFGEEGAARAWFGGPGNINKPQLTDAYERLSIGDYGKDYLKRLQGAATQTSGASGASSDPGGTATDDGDNPPTPTTIRPMLVAQAGDLGRIPGAFEPRAKEGPGPASGLRPADPVADLPIVKPVAPRKQETLTPEESRGWAILNHPRFAGDPQATEIAKNLIKFGEDKRNTEYQRKVTEYDKDLAAYETKAESERLYKRGLPKEQFELEKARQAEQQAQVERDQRPLGIDKHHTIVKDSYEQVKNVPSALNAIGSVKELLASNPGMFTGKGAGLQADLAAVANKLGLPYDPRAENTQTFRGLITPIIAALRPAIVGPGSQSQPEFKLLQDAAAGNVSLERGTIEKILTMIERQGVRDAINHQRVVIANAGSDVRGENLRQVWSSSYPLPMEKIAPRGAIAALRKSIAENPESRAAEIKAFDKTYYTPGLAERLLGD